MTNTYNLHSRFLLGAVSKAALVTGIVLALPSAAAAQGAAEAELAKRDFGVEDIIVTAQKRAENIQDVPISVTAISSTQLEAHRFQQISDLNGLAPNVIVNPGQTGKNNISTTVRGLLSAPVTPGQSPGVSFYLDGVYLANTYGNLLDLANVERIEVLKGPQGTLFGRSSVGGAISVITTNPVGEFHVKQTFTAGNYKQFRSKTHVELPRMGPLTANFTYMHFEREGDIKNLSGGIYWNLGPARDSLPYRGSSKNDIFRTADRLGDQNVDAFMATVRLEPSDDLTFTYKFDYAHNDFSSPGIGVANPAIFSGFPLLSLMLADQPPGTVLPLPVSKTRPDAISNDFAGPSTQRNYGHNLTTEWHINDVFTVKDVLAYRNNRFFNIVNFNGDSGLTVTPGLVAFLGLSAQYPAGSPAYGTPYLNAADVEFRDHQFSNELQLNVDTDWFTLTTGWIYADLSYKALNLKNIAYPNINGSYITGSGTVDDPYVLAACSGGGGFGASAFGCLPNGGQGQQNLGNSSHAIYGQAQIHATDQIDLVIGGRHSWDKAFFGGDEGAPRQDQSRSNTTWLLGVNYKPTDDVLLYVKASTGYIPGGIFTGQPFEAETALSYEAGAKADWFGRTLRTNLAVFHVTYKDLQGIGVVPGTNPPVVSITNSPVKGRAQGFELETTLVPTDGLTLRGAVGYTDLQFTDHDQPNRTIQAFAPEWTAILGAQYESSPQPMFAGGKFMAVVDASFASKHNSIGCVALFCNFVNQELVDTVGIDAEWTINGRLGLTEIPLGQAFGQETTMEIAFWVKNLTDNDHFGNVNADFRQFSFSGGWIPARTWGVDLTAKF